MGLLGKSVRSTKELDGTIDLLIGGGKLKVEKVTPPAGGPPAIWYRAG
jgi:hypothetical protein